MNKLLYEQRWQVAETEVLAWLTALLCDSSKWLYVNWCTKVWICHLKID